jgi:hypothetical protein
MSPKRGEVNSLAPARREPAEGVLESMKMKPVSPLPDFGFGFQDLDFKPASNADRP